MSQCARDKDRELLNKHYGKTVKYHATRFKIGELSSLGGFYIIAEETTPKAEKGSGQYVSRKTLLRLLLKSQGGTLSNYYTCIM